MIPDEGDPAPARPEAAVEFAFATLIQVSNQWSRAPPTSTAIVPTLASGPSPHLRDHLRDHFVAVVDAAVEGVRKPDPRIYLRAAEATGLPPPGVPVRR